MGIPCQVSSILQRNRVEIRFGITVPVAPHASWDWHPLPLGTGSPCQISTLFFFLVSPSIFLLVNLALPHGYLRLSYKLFGLMCPTFGMLCTNYPPFERFSLLPTKPVSH